MKKLFLFVTVACALLTSCGDDDDSPSATAITLTSDVTNGEIGDTFTFTVMDDLGGNVTSSATIYVDGTTVGSTFVAEEAGSYEVYAMYQGLTSPSITITVEPDVITPSDSFVVDGTSNFSTNTGWFAFYQVDDQGLAYWALNPFEEVNETYPNDLYIYFAIIADGPSGVDEETGEPFYTLQDLMPSTGVYTWSPDGSSLPESPAIFDVYVIADDEELVEDGDQVQTVTVNVSALDFSEENSNLEVTYTITLTDGTVIEGEYSGETGFYQPQAAPSRLNMANSAKTDLSFTKVK